MRQGWLVLVCLSPLCVRCSRLVAMMLVWPFWVPLLFVFVSRPWLPVSISLKKTCAQMACPRSKAVAGGVLLQVRPGVLRVWRISTSSLSLDGMTTLAGLDLVVRPLGLGRVRGMILAVVCVCWLCCWPAPLVPGVGLWPPWLRGSSDA